MARSGAHGPVAMRAGLSGTPWKAFRRLGWLLADHAVAVAVAHVPVSGMRAGDGRDPVSACLLTCDPTVAVVVVARERVTRSVRGLGGAPG